MSAKMRMSVQPSKVMTKRSVSMVVVSIGTLDISAYAIKDSFQHKINNLVLMLDKDIVSQVVEVVKVVAVMK
jgi:hypothetical protein